VGISRSRSPTGSATLLDEVLAFKITGEKDAYSRIGSGVADPTAGGRRRARSAPVGGQADNPAAAGWMTGGSYLVARKIRMEIESWDTGPLTDQERTFARHKSTGAPITGGDKLTSVENRITDPVTGDPVVGVNAHIRLASREQNGGIRLLRRGYDYTDGQDPVTGELAAGLLFIAFQCDPHAQSKLLQTRLARSDLLNEYIAHIGGGLRVCPPGLSSAGDWFGKNLFG
jgi:deferrochelatase/peroxidase EfeB